MQIVPLSPEGASRRTVMLGDVTVDLELSWNTSAGCWTLSLRDATGVSLADGLHLVPGRNLLQPLPSLRKLLGGLVVAERFPGAHLVRELLGSDVKLVWASPTEVGA